MSYTQLFDDSTRSDFSYGRNSLRRLLAEWVARDWLRQLDATFADFLWREEPDAHALLILAAALTSHQLGRGHVSLDLCATLSDPEYALSLPPDGVAAGGMGKPADLPAEVLGCVNLKQWQKALAHPTLVGSGAGNTPLVLAGSRLYLRRYWQYEQDLRAAIDRRLTRSASLQAGLPIKEMHQTLAVLFPKVHEQTNDWQRIACTIAAGNAFGIITGGPGTGKTTTVVRLLALLQALELAKPQQRPLRIRLAAPTGKAAARLNASISGAVANLPLTGLALEAEIRAAIPLKVSTLHRLLGSRPDSRHFKHHRGNPLSLDILVIDEASMVDLEMMTAVLAALPPSARLVLLGDKDQLASVEAGAVLGELCQRAQEGHYTQNTCHWVQAACDELITPRLIDSHGSALDQAIVMLRHSHRFAANSGIGQLAAAVNAGDHVMVDAIWNKGYGDLCSLPLNARDAGPFNALIVDGHPPAQTGKPNQYIGRLGYGHYLKVLRDGKPEPGASQTMLDIWARSVLEAHGQFQVLCALRQGRWGVNDLNLRIAQQLQMQGLIPASSGWYPGRPVLVTRNDYGLGLMNGDIGITLDMPGSSDDQTSLRVAFPAGDGSQGIKWILPSRLQAVETVYALTVHKSQGSEFAHVALVLPEAMSPILTRELIYTGITRAKCWFTLAHAGGMHVLKQAIARRVLRMSGLLNEPLVRD